MRNVIIVPAKGDSERFPRKNWMKLGEYTLFELALFRAARSHLGPVVFVTDSEAMIEKVTKRVFLSDYPIMLPEPFSKKRAVNSCIYALERLREQGVTFDNVIVTLPTSPLANEKHLREAYEMFIQNGRNTLASFTQVRGRPKLWRISRVESEGIDEKLKTALVEEQATISTDNGAVYIETVSKFIGRGDWFGDTVQGYFMNEVEGIDIDTQLDYLVAKTIYETKEIAD